MLAGQKLGTKEVDDGIWLASFMQYDLGYFDLEQKTLQRLDLGPFRYLCLRDGQSRRWCRKRDSNPRPRHYE
jgi:hypothetical protein